MHVNRKDTRIAFYCSSLSWGGLEINTLRYARWMQDAGYQVCIYTPAGTPLHDAAVRTGIPLRKIRRNRKYLDLSAAIQISRMFRADGMHVVWFR
ncbi:MAG: glycosyltransferase, partial [Bacteroidota bacterium]